jgi:hypothetical protein
VDGKIGDRGAGVLLVPLEVSSPARRQWRHLPAKRLFLELCARRPTAEGRRVACGIHSPRRASRVGATHGGCQMPDVGRRLSPTWPFGEPAIELSTHQVVSSIYRVDHSRYVTGLYGSAAAGTL